MARAEGISIRQYIDGWLRTNSKQQCQDINFASFLPFNHCVVRGRSTILRNYGYSTYRYSYPCLLFEATVTIETSFLILPIDITGNFSIRSFEHCK